MRLSMIEICAILACIALLTVTLLGCDKQSSTATSNVSTTTSEGVVITNLINNNINNQSYLDNSIVRVDDGCRVIYILNARYENGALQGNSSYNKIAVSDAACVGGY